ncbi:hypothetical protein BJV78DRAFT_171194 [Lactifluus subvellereus]|nr:hypothetical protein BJV78DRAFT_171194 [Lactifluus subvellereus]
MSSAGVSNAAALERLFHCILDERLTFNIAVASAALIFYDWLLTFGNELNFLWRRDRITYARVLFVLARYPALASAIMGLFSAGGKVVRGYDKFTSHQRRVRRAHPRHEDVGPVGKEPEDASNPGCFLSGLCNTSGSLTVRDITTTVEASSALPNVEGMKPCQFLESAVKEGRRVGSDAVQTHTVTDP